MIFKKKLGPFLTKKMSMETMMEELKPVASEKYEFQNQGKNFFFSEDGFLFKGKKQKSFNLRVIYKFKTVN